MRDWDEIRPRLELRRSWGSYRPHHCLLEIQCEVSFFGVCWVGIDVLILKNPFGYDIFFCLFGFGIGLTNEND